MINAKINLSRSSSDMTHFINNLISCNCLPLFESALFSIILNWLLLLHL